MSRARHEEKKKHEGKKHHRKEGGRTDMKVSGNPDVFEEADERKHGGRTKKKHVAMPEGKMAKHRMDRPGRKSGGRVGADKAPLSSAHRTTGTGDTARGDPD